MITKKLRLIVDFEASVAAFADEACSEEPRNFNLDKWSADPEWQRAQSRQQRLFEAATSRPEIVSELLRAYALLTLSEDALQRIFDVREDEEILSRVIETLPAHDQQHWRKVIDANLFPDAAEHITKRFRASIIRATFTDLCIGETVAGKLDALRNTRAKAARGTV